MRSPRLAMAVPFALAASLASLGASAKPAPVDAGSCYHFRTEVRYGAMGYNHLVYVTNNCGEPASCLVTTNANPQGVQAKVPPHEEVTVMTYLASPAREFTASIDCHPEP